MKIIALWTGRSSMHEVCEIAFWFASMVNVAKRLGMRGSILYGQNEEVDITEKGDTSCIQHSGLDGQSSLLFKSILSILAL
ncbi:hypothetical protein GCM10010965_08010 [Caldalkalibacillus thermarum]|nr:hypothetical protein GCM10010965_08010 [Caldalkalibacillus thermarum]